MSSCVSTIARAWVGDSSWTNAPTECRRWPTSIAAARTPLCCHGRTLYNELRHQPLTAGIPVVVVTGVDPTPEVPGDLGLRKPCGIDELIGALERALTPEEPTGRP